MIYQVMAVRDRTADVFGVPHFAATVGGAIRGFADEINRKSDDNMFNRHPYDFDLYHLGTYDDSTGAFECIGPPRQVAVGKDMLK